MTLGFFFYCVHRVQVTLKIIPVIYNVSARDFMEVLYIDLLIMYYFNFISFSYLDLNYISEFFVTSNVTIK